MSFFYRRVAEQQCRVAVLGLLAGILFLGQAAVFGPAPTAAADCGRTATGRVPLSDLGTGTYGGYQGGLYLQGSNLPPPWYRDQGYQQAQQVVPRDADGNAHPDGVVVLLALGMSNVAQEFAPFGTLAAQYGFKNPRLTAVNGAQDGADIRVMGDPSGAYWQEVERRLEAAGVVPAQVQVIWLKGAIAGPQGGFPDTARHLSTGLGTIVRIAAERYPHLRLVYLSSRIYGGYADTPLNPEPYAYESGFAVRWLIEERIAQGATERPWVAWGPYLWADGLRARSDGLVWECEDLEADGTHPSWRGERKVARLLLDFFTTEPTARLWFLSAGAS